MRMIRRRRAPPRGHTVRQVVAVLAACGFLSLAVPAPAQTGSTPQVFDYRVTHAIYGEIGTYRNTIERDGDRTTVQTRIQLRVRILGILLHREDAERTERWQGDRLVGFDGRTTVNGESTAISGTSSADGFALTSPEGTVVASATIRPSNPWSAGFLGADTMFKTDTGTVEAVRIGAPHRALTIIDAMTIPTREYAITADPSYRVWLDDHDVPVKFTVADESGLVTFTLTSPT
jgi:hypothetical protein